MLEWRATELPLLVTAILQVALALVLVGVRTPHRVNAALAVVLLARAGQKAGSWLSGAATDPVLAMAAERFDRDMFLAYMAALLFFLMVYPRPRIRGLDRIPPGLGAAAIAGVVVAMSLAFPGGWDEDLGGFWIFLLLALFAFPLGAWLLIRDARTMPPGTLRTSTVLVAASLALIEVSDLAADLVLELNLFRAIEAVLFVVLFGQLAHTAMRADVELSRQARLILTVLAVAAATGAMVGIAPGASEAFMHAWDLALPVLLTYALLRYQLLGIELRVKWTLRHGTMAAFFVAAFFFASEVASSLLSDRYGTIAGVAATAVLVFALAPLQRSAERLSDAAMPKVADTPGYHQFRKLEVYKAAVESMMEDGDLTPKERRALDALRAKLAIAPADAAALERDIVPPSAGASAEA